MKKFWHWLKITLAASAVLAVIGAIAYAIYDHITYGKFLDEEDEFEEDEDDYEIEGLDDDVEDAEANQKDFDEAYYHKNS